MIFKSKLPDIEIPSTGVYQHVTSNPYNISEDKEILVDGITDKRLSFGEFKRKSKRFAAGLHDKVGFQRGDVLAIISPNQVDYPIVLFGAIAAGGKVSPMNPTCSVAEISFQLSDSGASVIVTHPFFLSMVVKAAAEAQIPHSKVFLFGNEEVDGFQPCSTLFVDREFEPIEYTPEESKNTTVLLCYSSGTTGKSKGVETTHTNMIASVRQMFSFETEFGPHNVFMGVLPFFHIYGLQVLLHFALILGASVVLLPKFDLRSFCSVIQNYKVNYAHLVPPILLLLVKSPIVKEYDLSSLRMVTSSAAPLSTRLVTDIFEIYNIHVKQGYGLTEASPLITLVDEKNIVQGSIGVIVSNIEAKIISEDGKELGCNEPGELCIRGPNVMKGYLNNKEATDSSFDKDGFFHTGDVVTIDSQGNLFIVDRVKELIKYKGFQVPPAELEEILVSHPAVADAAVIGVNCETDATEYPLAYVKLLDGHEQSLDLSYEIKKFVSDQVAAHKRLKGVLFIDQIPKNTSGKILRRVLRERAKEEFLFSPEV